MFLKLGYWINRCFGALTGGGSSDDSGNFLLRAGGASDVLLSDGISKIRRP